MSELVCRRLIAVAVVALLSLGAVGCGSDDDTSGSLDETTTTVSNADGGTGSDDTSTDAGDLDAGSDDPSTDDSEDGVDGDVGAPVWSCEADSNNLSGSSTVLFSADVDTGQTEADITDETTAVISADGSGMEPASLTVSVDTVFGITIEEGGSLDGVIIGCAGGQTVGPGMTAGFLITEPGEYPVSLEISGTDVGTIVVE